MDRLAKKHWAKLPWEGDLGKDEKFKNLDTAKVTESAQAVLGDLDDLCVLLLFSVFESLVRDRILNEVDAERHLVHHPALVRAIDAMEDDVEHGSFARLLEPYKIPDAGLVEEVSQVRRYRNWVAHGRRSAQPALVDPRVAYERLKRFIALLDILSLATSATAPTAQGLVPLGDDFMI
jgi:hypothetical protein